VITQPLAVVTGASSGIGAAFATALARRGFHVLAVARREDRLKELAAAGEVTALALDLTEPGAVDAVLDRAAAIGPVELLVSNAGRGVHGRAWEISRADTAAMVQLNVTAGLDLATALLPGMVERRRGGLIVVTSAGGFYPTPHLAAYGATKAYLLSWAEALATELRGTGVRAMALCPGPVSTEFGDVAGMSDLMARAPGLMSAEDVVESALGAWRAGRTVHIPGRGNAVSTAVLARLPRALTRRVMEKAFRR
jgi:short-subunit dehydrogenase